MIKFIKDSMCSLVRSLVWIYGPAILTIVFALLQAHFFPGSPVWPIAVFFIFALVIVARYIK
ncbi:hypothetical protein PZBJ_06460 [Pantoea endophytica]|uniref:Uncharacterized protein n=1 Tax=Pantoea endophytica TaxID=92488 RepID=A0ABX4SXP9_9GAMM|nr:hypothetical protein PZBJ_06460 [Pantoea endophytica]QCP62038.1 hypothetical protein FCN45_21835 [Pantoea sp. SO10]